jgi:hypothetical protein
MQALSEWPDNPTAREGLERSIRAAAWFEVKAGNADAARALLTELTRVPGELVAAIRAVELDDEKSHLRKAHFQRLERELDPRVAIRQRAWLFIAVAAAVVVVTAVPSLADLWGLAEAWLGPYVLLAKLLPATVTYFVAVLLGRRSLLATRINRRIVATLALCFVALVLNRTVGAVSGLSADLTLTVDLVVLSAISAAAGVLFHWGFFISMAAHLAGLLAALAWPHAARVAFGGATAVALVGVIVTWTAWRSELTAPVDRDLSRTRGAALDE